MVWRGGHHAPIKVSGMENTEIQLENLKHVKADIP